MAINRTGLSLTDDDGSGTTGSVWNNANRTTLLDALDARWSTYSITSTGTVNNQSITTSGIEADVLFCNNSLGDLTLTGIAAPASPAKTGKRLLVMATSSSNVYLTHNSGSSSAAHRLIHRVTSSTLALKGNGSYGYAVYVYTGSNWVLETHEQGGYLTATFAAGSFTANGSMTWTLVSGDRTESGYYLRGQMLTYFYRLSSTTVGGTPNTTLQIGSAEFGGYTPSSAHVIHRVALCTDNGALTEAYTTFSGSTLQILRSAGGNWTASTDNTAVWGVVTFPVT